MTNLCVSGSYPYEEGFHMETTETKNTIQAATRETTESARKFGARLRTLAGGAADSSRRWVKRCGEAVSKGAQFTTL